MKLPNNITVDTDAYKLVHWAALPEGEHSVTTITQWLAHDMAPTIYKVRETLNYNLDDPVSN
jgi:hypothetical protein